MKKVEMPENKPLRSLNPDTPTVEGIFRLSDIQQLVTIANKAIDERDRLKEALEEIKEHYIESHEDAYEMRNIAMSVLSTIKGEDTE